MENGNLVLTRNKGEAIVIRGDIVVTVVEGNNVRLAIQAPKEIPVHRREVFEAIQREGDSDATS